MSSRLPNSHNLALVRGTGQRLPQALAIAALLLGTAAGGGGGHGGSGIPCDQGVRVFQDGVTAIVGTEHVVCPPPGAPPGQSFGNPSSQNSPVTFQPGSQCTYQVQEAVTFTPHSGGDPTVYWPIPVAGGPWPHSMALTPFVGGDWRPFYMDTGTLDFYQIFQLNGVIQANGVTCGPRDPNNPAASWTQICGGVTFGVYAACLGSRTRSFGPIGPVPASAIGGHGIDLAGYLRGQVNAGTLSSMPSLAGIVQRPTCFFLDGMTINGRDGTVPSWFEITLVGPPIDASNRHVLYIFRVEVVLDQVTFNFDDRFGDNSEAPQVPTECQGGGHQSTAAHTYQHYSPESQPFQVTATEGYAVHAWEIWNDGFTSSSIQIPDDQLPHLSVPAGPLAKTVVQEEGVPVGG